MLALSIYIRDDDVSTQAVASVALTSASLSNVFSSLAEKVAGVQAREDTSPEVV